MKTGRYFLLIIIGLTMMTANSFGASPIKSPNVSGQFYSANPAQLTANIDQFMSAAVVPPVEGDPLMIIAPHAGYVYSGGVAAFSYQAVSQRTYHTIVVLSPSHHYGFDGVAVWPAGGFKTPLGVIEVDQDFSSRLLEQDPKFIAAPQAFDKEHALEVQLPFLQRTFSGFKIVPVIVGQASFDLCARLAAALDTLIGDRDDVLVVVSSDMSHYHTAAEADAMDHRTLQLVEGLEARAFYDCCARRELEMCGFHPVTAALLLAQRRGLRPQVLKYAHSGDVSGDMDRVVGYGAVVFSKPAGEKESPRSDGQAAEKPAVDKPESGIAPLTRAQKQRLLQIASETIQEYVTTGKTKKFDETDPRLRAPEGAFVTIHKHGRLRGCIGHIVSTDPLFETVRDMAVAAASSDPRFNPVTPEELKDIDIEISVLSTPRVTRDVEEIRMGVHGVIVRRGPFHQGVFLPQVATETGWTREQFLGALCAQKAGLPADAWKDPRTELQIFTADVFSAPDVAQP